MIAKLGTVLELILLIWTLEMKCMDWEGNLVFSEDFDGNKLRSNYWQVEEGCEEVRHMNMAQECFLTETNNLEVANGSLIIRAGSIYLDDKVFYTSGRVRGSGFGFTYGTYVIRAKLPYGKHLIPSFYLLPINQHMDRCKYEEIDIMEYRGERTSTVLFSAKYGRTYENVFTRSTSKVFHGVDFSQDFHTFAVKWLPTRIEWYVDMMKIHEVNTHFVNDWTNGAGDNIPCSKNKRPFAQQSSLFINLSVGGNMYPSKTFGNLTEQDAKSWPKPSLEIDYVRVYNDKAHSPLEKLRPVVKKGYTVPTPSEVPLSLGYL